MLYTIFDPPTVLKVWFANLIYSKSAIRIWRGRGDQKCRSGPKIFIVFWVSQSPIGLISTEIGTL